MKVISVVGTRPQIIKSAAVTAGLRERATEIRIHTGQHYDDLLSDVFFRELEIPIPDYHLDVGSGPHGFQTARMLERLEPILQRERPDWVLVYGDTNSTLAGALAAAKLHLPTAHVEAGLRSFNRRMPEEINRVVVDHLSSLLFCPTETAFKNLAGEGIVRGVHRTGDVMLDVLRSQVRRAEETSNVLHRTGVEPGRYFLATIHRAENTDDPVRLEGILAALGRIAAAGNPVVFPVHPRTRARLDGRGASAARPGLLLMDPLSYRDMLVMEKRARAVLTDSGGVQKEAYWLGVPCVTLREETEWVETVEDGWNVLAGVRTEAIVERALAARPPAASGPAFGEGGAGREIARLLTSTTPEARG